MADTSTDCPPAPKQADTTDQPRDESSGAAGFSMGPSLVRFAPPIKQNPSPRDLAPAVRSCPLRRFAEQMGKTNGDDPIRS